MTYSGSNICTLSNSVDIHVVVVTCGIEEWRSTDSHCVMATTSWAAIILHGSHILVVAVTWR